jgi:predicted dehydrogenase
MKEPETAMETFSSNRRQFLGQTIGLAGAFAAVQAQAQGTDEPRPLQPKGAARQVSPGKSDGGAVPLAPPDKQPPDLKVPDAPERKLGWAIVGLGQLALEEIMPAFGGCKLAKPVALVSGHPDKARRVALAYGIAADAIYNYENYDKLAEDKRVDVIYIVLPNSMHAEFTIRGLKAGKHVLCEKPMAGSVKDAEEMIAAAEATGKKLGVAYRLHYEPLNQKVMEMCKERKFGAIKTFVSSNCQDVKAPNIRLSGALKGGPLGDVGVYSINAARYVIGEEPVEVSAFEHTPSDDDRFREVPESVTFQMRYPSGVLAHCDCSFGSAESRFYTVHCVKGTIGMDPSFSYRGLKLWVREGDPKKGNGEKADLLIPQVDHFAAEMDGFSEALLQDKHIRTPGSMGLADMRIVAAIEESVKTGQPVRLSPV